MKTSEWEHLRAAFEADAGPLGFDLERYEPHEFVEPWCDYQNEDTGMRWGGFIAGHQAGRAQALEEAAIKCFSMRDEEDDLHWRGAMLAASGAIRDLKASVPPDQETQNGV